MKNYGKNDEKDGWSREFQKIIKFYNKTKSLYIKVYQKTIRWFIL